MRRFLTFISLAGVALALAAAGVADPGDKGKGKKQGHNRFTFTLTTTDNGCHGTPWANDVETRTYIVHENKNGTFRLTRRDKGTFTTIGTASPGSCPNVKGRHGTTVRSGVTGRFNGYLTGTISGGTFNPNATCAAACFTDDFITAFFGSGATFSCFTNSTDCKFNFNYTSSAQPLLVRHWQDRGKGAGTMLKEVFIGDIASS
jgi:hypothetical protein